eukprot:152647-Alexandrium_andersonii.AAC.1
MSPTARAGGWVLAGHLATRVWQNLHRGVRGREEPWARRRFMALLRDMAATFALPKDAVALLLLAVESDKARFESCR